MQTFAHPFRFVGGKLAKLDADSDAFAAQIVGAAIQTGKGELPLTPTFGSDPPEFNSVDAAGLVFSVSAFHPEIQITKLVQTVDPETEAVQVRVSFNRGE